VEILNAHKVFKKKREKKKKTKTMGNTDTVYYCTRNTRASRNDFTPAESTLYSNEVLTLYSRYASMPAYANLMRGMRVEKFVTTMNLNEKVRVYRDVQLEIRVEQQLDIRDETSGRYSFPVRVQSASWYTKLLKQIVSKLPVHADFSLMHKGRLLSSISQYDLLFSEPGKTCVALLNLGSESKPLVCVNSSSSKKDEESLVSESETTQQSKKLILEKLENEVEPPVDEEELKKEHLDARIDAVYNGISMSVIDLVMKALQKVGTNDAERLFQGHRANTLYMATLYNLARARFYVAAETGLESIKASGEHARAFDLTVGKESPTRQAMLEFTKTGQKLPELSSESLAFWKTAGVGNVDLALYGISDRIVTSVRKYLSKMRMHNDTAKIRLLLTRALSCNAAPIAGKEKSSITYGTRIRRYIDDVRGRTSKMLDFDSVQKNTQSSDEYEDDASQSVYASASKTAAAVFGNQDNVGDEILNVVTKDLYLDESEEQKEAFETDMTLTGVIAELAKEQHQGSNISLQKFSELLEKAGPVKSAISSEGEWTVFAVNDKAFENFETDENNVSLANLVAYHVVKERLLELPSKAKKVQLQTGQHISLQAMAGGKNTNFVYNAQPVRVGGQRINALNGTLWIVDRVLDGSQTQIDQQKEIAESLKEEEEEEEKQVPKLVKAFEEKKEKKEEKPKKTFADLLASKKASQNPPKSDEAAVFMQVVEVYLKNEDDPEKFATGFIVLAPTSDVFDKKTAAEVSKNARETKKLIEKHIVLPPRGEKPKINFASNGLRTMKTISGNEITISKGASSSENRLLNVENEALGKPFRYDVKRSIYVLPHRNLL